MFHGKRNPLALGTETLEFLGDVGTRMRRVNLCVYGRTRVEL